MKQKVNFQLNLTVDELLNFYSMVFGLSFASSNSEKTKNVSEIMTQLAEQTENTILGIDPKNLYVLNEIKTHIKEAIINKRKTS